MDQSLETIDGGVSGDLGLKGRCFEDGVTRYLVVVPPTIAT